MVAPDLFVWQGLGVSFGPGSMTASSPAEDLARWIHFPVSGYLDLQS